MPANGLGYLRGEVSNPSKSWSVVGEHRDPFRTSDMSSPRLETCTSIAAFINYAFFLGLKED